MFRVRDTCEFDGCAGPAFWDDNVCAVALWFNLFFDGFLAINEKYITIINCQCYFIQCSYYVLVKFILKSWEVLNYHSLLKDTDPNQFRSCYATPFGKEATESASL